MSSKPRAKHDQKAPAKPALKVDTLPRKLHVVIDGVPVTLHAAKGKRTLSATKLRAVMAAVKAERNE